MNDMHKFSITNTFVKALTCCMYKFGANPLNELLVNFISIVSSFALYVSINEL